MHAATPQAKSIFGQALAIDTPAERAAYLEQACGGDAALRAEVESLLAALQGAGDFLKQPILTVDSEPGTSETGVAVEAVGNCIGPYKLLQLLGEGGMGTVWVAEQTDPVKRRVALKVIKPGMDSAQVIRRFEAERQALALMDHSHIARVFDAGTTAGGRPYFVMELVKGVPITRYCDELHLPIRERLALFIPVCQAIQHAHQKGIIHRDVKPSNVLVCIQDGRPVAKVIDFGIAKALHQKLSEHSLYTEIGQVVGTLQYMSPEQAELSALDIDTRADVYALGVLLYELLTGTTPLDRKRLQSVALLEVLRLIREEEPPRPSTRLTDSRESLASVAAQRRTEPGRLTKEVRGELDWIVMKTLEKDRTRRYEAASSLARDLENYLRDEPVEACPPSAGYRLKKLLRRYKRPVAAAAAVFLVLLAGVAVSTWQWVRALRAEEATRRQRDRAETENWRAQAVRDFLLHDLLRQADAEEQAERLRLHGLAGFEVHDNPTIRELLDRAAAELTPEKIEVQFPAQPLVQAEILTMVGRAYRGVGEYARAITHLERAADLRRTHLEPNDLDTLATLNYLALAYQDVGRTAEAIDLLEKGRDVRITQQGPDHPETLATLNNLAIAYQGAGKTAEAIALFEKVRDTEITKLGPDHPRTLTTLNNMALAYKAAGKTAEAIALLEKVRDARITKLGPDHPHTLTTLDSLAGTYKDAGRTDEAIALYEKIRDPKITKLGPDHPHTLATLSNLAGAYREAGRTAEAIALFEKVRDAESARFGPDHLDTLNTLHHLALAYKDAERTAEAITLLEKVRDAEITRLAPDHPRILTTLGNLAGAYQHAGKTAEAIALYEKVRDARSTKLGPDHRDTLSTLQSLAEAYQEAGKTDKAIALFEKLRDIRSTKLGPDHTDTLSTLYLLAGAYRAAERTDEAIALLEKVRDACRTKYGPDHEYTLTTLQSLGWAYEEAGRTAEAIALFEKVRDARIIKPGPDHPDTLGTLHNLAGAYMDAGRMVEGIALYEKVRDARITKHGPDHQRTLTALNNLALAYEDVGKTVEAITLYEKVRDAEIAKLGPDDPLTLTTLHNLAGAYRDVGRTDEAIALFVKVRDGRIARLGPDHPRLTDTLNEYGRTLIKAGKSADAEPILRQCLAIREKKEADAWKTFHTKSLLGGSLLNQKKYADAEPLLLAGYEGLKQRAARIPVPRKDRLTEALERLVQLYEATGKKDQAAKWHTELQKLKESAKPEKQP